MKIICKDNFDRDSVSDTLVAENVSEYYAPIIVNFMNSKLSGEHSSDYFAAVPDDYVLYVFKP